MADISKITLPSGTTYNIKDDNFLDSELYQDFIAANPARGSLRIRAYAASQAIPISGVQIVISTIYDNNKIIFFEGQTDESGLIERIILPAPKLNLDNLEAPNKTTYEIVATYIPDNIRSVYSVNMYENVCVVQNINVVPENLIEVGGM